MSQLAFRDVVKVYGSVRAVDGVSFDVAGGEVFGLLGPNGAGKSTLIRMAMDILRPDSGTITIAGQASPVADRDRVGYLPEERGLYRKQKVVDVLDYFGRLKGMPGRAARKAALDALGRVGLSEWAKRRVDELSKGMQQKVQIVGALLHDPDIVVLDEPFTGLDPVNTRLVKDIIVDMKKRGKLVVLSTHQMNQVEEMCDRIAMIDRGRLVLYGPLRDIKRRWAPIVREASHGGVHVIVEGEGDFAAVLGVVAAEPNGAGQKLTLEHGLTPHDWLARAVAAGLDVERFEAAPVPLEDIFVHVVGEGAREAAS